MDEDRKAEAGAVSAFLSSPGGEEFKKMLERVMNIWFTKLCDPRVQNTVTVAKIHGGLQFAQELYREMYGAVNFGRIVHETEVKSAEGFYEQEKKRRFSRFDRAAI